MAFCVNCGYEYQKKPIICPNCNFSPSDIEYEVDEYLNKIKNPNRSEQVDLDFEYPKEKFHLIIAVLIATTLAIIISGVTIGVFLILLAFVFLSFRIKLIRDKAQLIPVNPTTFDKLHKLVKLSAYRLCISVPPVHVRQDPVPNAFTYGFWGESIIVLHSSIVEMPSPSELLFVIGHEMSHLK